MEYWEDFVLNVDYDVIRTNKKIEYINLECSFDIETTSHYVQDNKVAFMYEWTFGLKDGNNICYGRTWNEFLLFIDRVVEYFELSPTRILTCYIHNLGYEFQFMRKYFDWQNVFSISERKPIKALTTSGIEFKDSYILSGYSLDMLAKNLVKHDIKKLVGNLDYSLIRHSKTKLTDDELAYCNNDVEIILAYINEQMDLYGDITKIPLTNTGRVRKFVKDKCYHSNTNHRKESRSKFFKYRRIMEELQITTDEYILLKSAFMGGFTHASSNYSGKVVKDVHSIDFTSSYPAVMLMEKFPMSRGIRTIFTKEKNFYYYLQRYCLVFEISFTNLRSKISYDNYLSESKTRNIKNPVINNGRVYSADYLETTLTDVDYNIMMNCYEWDSIEVGYTVRYCKGYLPKDIILSIVELYEKKTTLKDVKGMEVEYLLSKGMLNSVYGMSVTDIVRDNIEYETDWNTTQGDSVEQIEKYNQSYSRFLFYAWGVWVTAYARRNLWYGIISIADDYIYSDTDSIKFINYDKHTTFINEYNKMVESKLKTVCKLYKIPVNRMKPTNQNGDTKLIGAWDYEGKYTRFKTLGAKRYLTEFKDGSLALTVAGLSKKNGIEYLKKTSKDNTEVFNKFNDEMYIPADETGKMTHTYIDVEYNFMCMDYQGNECMVNTKSGVHLEKCDFTLSISKQYGQFLKMLLSGYKYKGVEVDGK